MLLVAHAWEVQGPKVQENPLKGSSDTDEQVLSSTSKVPLLMARSQRKLQSS